MKLRTRLAWTYGIAVTIAVAIVAVVSFTAIDRTLRGSLDARLATTASAVAALVDVRNGALLFDAEDREQMIGALAPAMSGAIFTRNGAPFVTSTASTPAEILRAARRGVYAAVPVTAIDRGQRLRVSCRPIARGSIIYGHACVWESAAYIDDVDRDAILAIALSAALAGGAVVVLSATLARRALAPLHAFSDLATEIEAHDLSRRVRHGGEDELGRLGSAFDRMLDRLESAFARQRRFTADASHELRAPLAVIRAEADAALEGEPATAQYRSALQTIVSEVERIDAIVDALLLAARADSARLHFEPVDLAAHRGVAHRALCRGCRAARRVDRGEGGVGTRFRATPAPSNAPLPAFFIMRLSSPLTKPSSRRRGRATASGSRSATTVQASRAMRWLTRCSGFGAVLAADATERGWAWQSRTRWSRHTAVNCSWPINPAAVPQ